MNKLLVKSGRFLKRNSSTILTCVGAAGVVATTVMAVKATPKATRLLEEARKEKGEELTKFEVVKIAGPVYIPTVITGVSTIACIFGANVLNKRKQAALMSAYALLDNSYKDYRNKVEELHGEEANKKIREEIAKDKYEETDISVDGDKQLFYDMFSERYFESTPEEVLMAQYEINRRLATWGGATLNEFYELVGIPATDYGEFLGWSAGTLMETYWEAWLEFYHEKAVMEDGLECIIITFGVEPMYDFEYY